MKPVLGLIVAPGTSDRCVRPLTMLSRWCKPLAARRDEQVAAWFATSTDVPRLDALIERSGRPVAVWVEDGEEAHPDAITVGPDGSGVRFTFKPEGFDVKATRWLNPFVRSRYRKREGLPGTWVVDLRQGLDTTTMHRAIAYASCVIAGPDRAIAAMSAGCPVVTDPACAEQLGAVDGIHLVVTDRPQDAALNVASDAVLGARLSLTARRMIEERFDNGPAARSLARALGLTADDVRLGSMPEVWEELGTPDDPMLRQLASRVLPGSWVN